jgi:UDP-N-acetylmuramyl pentapeptide synthase
MGFYVPEKSTLCDIARPQIGIVTNIGRCTLNAPVRLKLLPSKSELVQALPPAPRAWQS